MLPRWRLLALTILACATGCARVGNEEAGTPRARDDATRYEATAMVLSEGARGPMLCLGLIETSLPPQCEGIPITNWDWDAVEGEERMGGFIWGEYHVVGSFDGSSFTIDDAGPPGRAPGQGGGDSVDTACPEPEGGWRASDPSRTSERDVQAAMRAAESEPDFAGLWVDAIPGAADGYEDLGPEPPEAFLKARDMVLNVAFTDDLERHEAEIRQEWGGALCIVRHERTEAELERIQEDLPRASKELDLEMLSAGIDVVDNVVELEVVVLTDEAVLSLDERYGEGVVRATGMLQPVR